MTLQLRNFGAKVGDTPVVWDATCDIPAAAVAGIAGPVGCGKTMLLRALAGLVEAQGQAFLDGVDLAADPGWARLRTGYVSDEDGLYEDATVEEHLTFFAACHGVPARDRKPLVDDLLEVVDLAGRRCARVATLSRGTRRRLRLAQALVHDPDLLLLDEPAAGLDSRAWSELSDLMGELRALGKTVLFTTGDAAALGDVATHVGVMNGGRLVAFGTLGDILAQARRARFLRVRIVGDVAPVIEMLRSLPLVRDVAADGPVVRVAYLGGDGAVQSVLAALVRAGQPVVGFEEGYGSLEDVVRQITEG